MYIAYMFLERTPIITRHVKVYTRGVWAKKRSRHPYQLFCCRSISKTPALGRALQEMLSSDVPSPKRAHAYTTLVGKGVLRQGKLKSVLAPYAHSLMGLEPREGREALLTLFPIP